MYRLLTIVLFLLSIGLNSAFSQISKGTIRIGPDLGYANTTQKFDGVDTETKISSLQMVVSAGYFIIDNLEVAANLQLTTLKSKFGNNENKTTGIGVGPSATYMVAASENIYIPISAGFIWNSQKQDGTDTKITGLSYGLGTGLEYLINNKLGARLTMNYNFGKLTPDNSDFGTKFSDIIMGVGVNFYFNSSSESDKFEI